jgi:manganese transport protein
MVTIARFHRARILATVRTGSGSESVSPKNRAGTTMRVLQTASRATYGKVVPITLPGLAGVGAAFAVSIGYMDPGNWATDLNAASYHYALLWAVVASGFAACILQVLVLRFVGASGLGLSEAVRLGFPRLNAPLSLVYIGAIIATEISEFVGLVVGLQMVFRLDFRPAIGIGLAVFLLLLLTGGSMFKRFERIAIATTSFLAVVYAVEIGVLHPPLLAIVKGTTLPVVPDGAAWIAVVGIVGATIMPHNLFLHAGLFKAQLTAAGRRNVPGAVKRAALATVCTLFVATLVNAAILIVGAATDGTTIEGAFLTLRPLAGPTASLVFGLALIGVSLAATAGGACAGDIVCADAPIKLSQPQRRVIALAPAVVLLVAGCSPTLLLVWSQVALALALPGVVIPLFMLVVRQRDMKNPFDRALVGASALVLLASCTCDVILFSSLPSS